MYFGDAGSREVITNYAEIIILIVLLWIDPVLDRVHIWLGRYFIRLEQNELVLRQ